MLTRQGSWNTNSTRIKPLGFDDISYSGNPVCAGFPLFFCPNWRFSDFSNNFFGYQLSGIIVFYIFTWFLVFYPLTAFARGLPG